MFARLSPLQRKLLYFCMIGTVGFLVDAGLLMGLLHYTALGPLSGRVVSFLVAVVVTWQLNRRFTFSANSGSGSLVEFARYLGSSSLGIALNLGIYTALVLSLPFFASAPQYAVAIGSVAALSVNFVLANYWVFK